MLRLGQGYKSETSLVRLLSLLGYFVYSTSSFIGFDNQAQKESSRIKNKRLVLDIIASGRRIAIYFRLFAWLSYHLKASRPLLLLYRCQIWKSLMFWQTLLSENMPPMESAQTIGSVAKDGAQPVYAQLPRGLDCCVVLYIFQINSVSSSILVIKFENYGWIHLPLNNTSRDFAEDSLSTHCKK